MAGLYETEVEKFCCQRDFLISGRCDNDDIASPEHVFHRSVHKNNHKKYIGENSKGAKFGFFNPSIHQDSVDR